MIQQKSLIQQTILKRRKTRGSGFKGNLALRSENENINYTNEQIAEIIRCSQDPIYFIKKYVRIVHVDKGLIPFELYDFQEEIIQTCHNNRFVIMTLPRQSGKSTTITSYFLWYVLFNKEKSVAILGNKFETARELMGRFQKSYELIPKWLQAGVKEWNKSFIELANGSKVYASGTTAGGIRGKSVNIIMLDEFAHVLPHLAEEFFTSTYPTISSGTTTKVFIISTPNGMNKFYKMWDEAIQPRDSEKWNGYIPLTYHWSRVPGRDEAWMKDQIDKLGSQEKFDQEFGNEFLGTGGTLLSGATLKELEKKVEVPISRLENDTIRIYDRPKFRHTYVCVCDVSRGQGLDAQAFSIIDITKIPYKVVVSFSDSKLAPILYPNVIYQYATEYNDAFVLVEINDIGQMITDTLQYELAYENMIKVRVKGKQGQQVSAGFQKSVQFGIRTTTPVKKIGCASLKTLIERNKLLVPDEKTVKEFRSFVVYKDSYAAEEGSGLHDDLVMSLVLFGWLSNQNYFKDTTGTNIRETIMKEMQMIDEEVIAPFGVISTGLEEENTEPGWARW